MEMEDYGEARRLLVEALAGQRTRLGDKHTNTVHTLMVLGVVTMHVDREEAQRLLMEAYAAFCEMAGREYRLPVLMHVWRTLTQRCLQRRILRVL